MQRKATGLRVSWTLSALIALTVTSPAFGAGFQLKEQSAEGQGNAFAGSTAKAYDLSTIFFNPAGMTRLSGHQAGVVVSYISPRAEFTASGSPTIGGGAPLSGSRTDQAGEDAVVPAFYAFWDYNPDLKFGLAVNTPWGLMTEYSDQWVGRYHAIKSDLKTVNVAPSVAYQINEQLSVGAGIQIQYADAELTNAVPVTLIVGVPSADGKATLKGDDWGFGANVGLLYEFSPQTRVGLNYRSRVSHEIKGDIDFSGVPVSDARFADTGAKADLITPDIVSVGMYHEISPQWAVMADVSWTNWSTFDELRVKRANGADDIVTQENWDDSWFFAVGATYRPSESWALRTGIAYDKSPVPDEFRTPRIPDEDRYWISFGASYSFAQRFVFDIGYTHIFVDDASLNLTSPTAGNVSGSYENSVDIIAASLIVRF